MRFILPFIFLLASCSVYKSPDRKDFESTQPAFTATTLQLLDCADTSVKRFSENSKIVKISSQGNNHSVLWEHVINGKSFFETDNLKGTYCLYENN